VVLKFEALTVLEGEPTVPLGAMLIPELAAALPEAAALELLELCATAMPIRAAHSGNSRIMTAWDCEWSIGYMKLLYHALEKGGQPARREALLLATI
jgi:hypothetical protein